MVASMVLTMAGEMVAWKEDKTVDLKDASTAVEMVWMMAELKGVLSDTKLVE